MILSFFFLLDCRTYHVSPAAPHDTGLSPESEALGSGRCDGVTLRESCGMTNRRYFEIELAYWFIELYSFFFNWSINIFGSKKTVLHEVLFFEKLSKILHKKIIKKYFSNPFVIFSLFFFQIHLWFFHFCDSSWFFLFSNPFVIFSLLWFFLITARIMCRLRLHTTQGYRRKVRRWDPGRGGAGGLRNRLGIIGICSYEYLFWITYRKNGRKESNLSVRGSYL